MKLYLAGAMSGLPENGFPAFEAAAARLRGAGYDVLSAHEVALPCGCASSLTPCGNGNHEYVTFLRNDLLAMLSHADGIALLDGWERSNGARLEFHVAEALDIPPRSVGAWLARAVRAA